MESNDLNVHEQIEVVVAKATTEEVSNTEPNEAKKSKVKVIMEIAGRCMSLLFWFCMGVLLVVAWNYRPSPKHLIDAGDDFGFGWTPLHAVAVLNDVEVAKLLIDVGADVNAKDNGGKTPLYIAAESNSVKVAKLLIDAGADVNEKDDSDVTPLYKVAVFGESVEVAKLLIDAGADVNEKDNNGVTLLHGATDLDSVEVAKLLIDAGANVNAKYSGGVTPLRLAEVKNSEDIIKALSNITDSIREQTPQDIEQE